MSPIETLGTWSTLGLAGLVCEADRLTRARWVTLVVNATSCRGITLEAIQAICEIGSRRNEGEDG